MADPFDVTNQTTGQKVYSVDQNGNLFTAGAVTTTGGISAPGTVQFGGTTVLNGHVLWGGTTPSAAAGLANGGTPPAPVVTAGANDNSGILTFGTGSSPSAGSQVVVTFSSAFQTARTPVVNITPQNGTTTTLNLYATAVSTTGFTISSQTTPSGTQAASTFSVAYMLIG